MTKANASLRFGMQTLASGLLLAGSVIGLLILDSQTPIFSFESHWPDARTFPMFALAFLAVATCARLILNFRKAEDPIGPARRVVRVMAVTVAMIVALAALPWIGFFASASIAAIATALALGERRLVYSLGLTLAVAAIVTFGARYGLSIPLP
jgi:hypothetical protein